MNTSNVGYSATAWIGLIAIGIYVAVLGWSVQNTTYDAWGGLLIAPLIALVTFVAVRRLTDDEPDRRLAHLLMLALVLKLGACLVRYVVTFDVYGGIADATNYHATASSIAGSFRQLDFSVDLGRRFVGTGFISAATGVMYALIGVGKIGAYLVFAWLGFWGQYLLYRAFRISSPDGDHHKYALLVFFVPSMLYWPASIGKEAWMILAIGMCAYGAARWFRHMRGGIIWLAAGLVATSVVRPHISLLIIAAVSVGFVTRRSVRGDPAMEVAAKLIGIAVLVAGTVIVASQASRFFGIDDLGPSSVTTLLDTTAERTTKEGSSFTAPSVHNVLEFPQAILTVLFRPLPFDAHNAQAAVVALEGTFLLSIAIGSSRRLLGLPRLLLTQPYVAFCFAYTLLFVYGFSSFGNFGLLARQRVQVLPFFFVLLLAGGSQVVGRRPSAHLTQSGTRGL